MAGVKELRLLIYNTTNRETLEQLAEGYQRFELVREADNERSQTWTQWAYVPSQGRSVQV